MCRSSIVIAVMIGCQGAPTTPTTTTSPSPKALPASKPRFVDYPLPIGTCQWISIGETSEILGQQLQYLGEPDDKQFSCVLVPASGEGPIQPIIEGGNQAWESRPNVWVTDYGDVDTWEPSAGIGERSVWESDDPFAELWLGAGDTVVRLDLNWPRDKMPAESAKRRALLEAIARKVYVHLKDHPAEP